MLEYIGAVIDKDKRNEIKQGIKQTHAIPFKPRHERKAIVLTLCPHCREKYMSDSEMLVRRVDPLQAEKERCDKCGVGYGYEYMVMKKEHTKRRKD